jgi:hypothetical protein
MAGSSEKLDSPAVGAIYQFCFSKVASAADSVLLLSPAVRFRALAVSGRETIVAEKRDKS